MAIYYARKSGNVNATDVWATTPTGTAGDFFSSFTSSDTLMANNFTITLNVNTTVLEVRTDTTGGATAGGSFALNNNVILTANVIAGSSNGCVNYSGTTPHSATIVGSVSGGTGSGASGAVIISNAGTLNIIGNATGGDTGQSTAVQFNSSNAILNITGNVTGGGASNAYGIFANLGSAQTINVIGTVTGGTSGPGILASVPLITVNVTGSAVGGSGAVGVSVTASATVTIQRAKGNNFGNGSVGLTSQVGVSCNQTGFTRVYEIEYGDLGQSPTSGPVFLFPSSSNVALFYRSGTTKKTLVDASNSSGLLPSTSNVRSGITYNAGNNIGTMGVPSAQSVALGVPVDNTTGTAVLTTDNIGDIWNYPVSGISVSNSIGERLKNCSTVASMGQQLAAALNNVQ